MHAQNLCMQAWIPCKLVVDLLLFEIMLCTLICRPSLLQPSLCQCLVEVTLRVLQLCSCQHLHEPVPHPQVDQHAWHALS